MANAWLRSATIADGVGVAGGGKVRIVVEVGEA
jgi:hypothetical protein